MQLPITADSQLAKDVSTLLLNFHDKIKLHCHCPHIQSTYMCNEDHLNGKLMITCCNIIYHIMHYHHKQQQELLPEVQIPLFRKNFQTFSATHHTR